MKALRCAAVVALASMLAPAIASAGTIDSLPAADRLQILAGVAVVHTQDLAGSSWPGVTVYQLVNAAPEAAMAIFTDYDEQASYLKDCCGDLQSRVLDRAVGGDPRVQRVLYEIEVPVVSNERYELREEMSREAGGSYRVTWRKVSAGGHTDAIVGYALFEPHDGKTVFTYNSTTWITAFGAGVFADASVTRTQETATTIARHIEQESAGGGAGFQADLARLRAALGG